ncbi:hypothetical protein J3459_010287 [Metarhizium acridum]|nr:hypothetical protein J3459_010287 [Metarhizium acridum]
MGSNMFSVLTNFLQQEVIDDDQFRGSFTEERIDANSWVVHRSYIHHTHVIQERLTVELRDQDDIPHIRCALILASRTLESCGCPDHDTRVRIFKPHAWYGPALVIEARQELRTPQDSESDDKSEGSLLDAASHKLETRILLMAKSYVKGLRILVQTPTRTQRQKLERIRNSVKVQRSQNDRVATLMNQLEQFKRDGVKPENLCSETISKTNQNQQQCTSEHNIGCFLTGITKLPSLLGDDQGDDQGCGRMRDNKPANCGRAVDRILKLGSRLNKYYGNSIANATFTFLELGGCKVLRLGQAAVQGKDEGFFYDAVFSLIDLSWQRIVTATDPDQQPKDHIGMANTDTTLPIINPVGLYSWYTGLDYVFTCQKLKQEEFLNVPQGVAYQLPTRSMLGQTREKSVSPPGTRSKLFVLANAERLATYITCKTIEKRSSGYQDSEDLQLAMRILKGHASPEEVNAAPMTVVYIILDILLDTYPTLRKGQPAQKQITSSKRRRTTDMHPGKYANIPAEPQHQPAQTGSGSSSQIQRFGPYHNDSLERSNDLGGVSPAFNNMGRELHDTSLFCPPLHPNATNTWGQGDFGAGMNLNETLHQLHPQIVPNGNDANNTLPSSHLPEEPENIHSFLFTS